MRVARDPQPTTPAQDQAPNMGPKDLESARRERLQSLLAENGSQAQPSKATPPGLRRFR